MPTPPSRHRFDRVVMVDWSANSSPKRGRDSIWIASGSPSQGVEHLVNPPTRSEAFAWLVDHLSSDMNERVLVGFDFSFGYPTGFATALTGQSDATWVDVWRWMAEHLVDDERNRNNRFDVMAAVNMHLQDHVGVAPFWGYPGSARADALPRTKPGTYHPFPEFRVTEQRLRTQGLRPFSAWQLAYNGSVGSQILLGMFWLSHLRTHPALGRRLCVWPFETGLGPRAADLTPGQVLVAEVWPSLWLADASEHPVRDAAQVITLTRRIMTADIADELNPWFDPDLNTQERSAVTTEEGWTLGVL